MFKGSEFIVPSVPRRISTNGAVHLSTDRLAAEITKLRRGVAEAFARSVRARRQLPAGNVPHAVVTFAANVCPAPGKTLADAGTMAMLKTRSGATLTVIDASFAASACACAVTMQ